MLEFKHEDDMMLRGQDPEQNLSIATQEQKLKPKKEELLVSNKTSHKSFFKEEKPKTSNFVRKQLEKKANKDVLKPKTLKQKDNDGFFTL